MNNYTQKRVFSLKTDKSFIIDDFSKDKNILIMTKEIDLDEAISISINSLRHCIDIEKRNKTK